MRKALVLLFLLASTMALAVPVAYALNCPPGYSAFYNPFLGPQGTWSCVRNGQSGGGGISTGEAVGGIGAVVALASLAISALGGGQAASVFTGTDSAADSSGAEILRAIKPQTPAQYDTARKWSLPRPTSGSQPHAGWPFPKYNQVFPLHYNQVFHTYNQVFPLHYNQLFPRFHQIFPHYNQIFPGTA